MSKNIIHLFNKVHGGCILMNVNSHDIFKRDDMMNCIQAIENKEYTYDDIRAITVVNLLEVDVIDDLPHNLSVLSINHTTLQSLVIPRECLQLNEIYIKESNLSSMPEIYFLPRLRVLHLESANIQCIQDRYPLSLESINLTSNGLNDRNTDLTNFPKNIPIILMKNGFLSKTELKGYNIVYGTQYGNTVHKVISNYSIQRHEARIEIERGLNNRQLLQNVVQMRHEQNVVQQNVFNTSQTVHISSICNSVTKSLYKINELTDSIYSKSIESVLIDELIEEFYLWNLLQRCVVCFSFVFKSDDRLMIDNVRQWVSIKDVNSKTMMTYGELLARVWILIKNHGQKQDFIDNVKIELSASVGFCFLGRFNRLVNALVGFVDGIMVGISIKEQLQLEIGKMIAKLGLGEIGYEECYRNIVELFEDVDVKEDETITSYYKQSWLDALDDYKPDAVLIHN